MRKLSPKDISVIAEITRARERAALARISEAAASHAEASEAVAKLLAINHEARNTIEAELISKWNQWKQAELKRRNTELAAAKAAYQVSVKESGRQIAEHAVVT